jgi:beta-xylosidase
MGERQQPASLGTRRGPEGLSRLQIVRVHRPFTDISQKDGSYVLYYSAALAQSPSKHCVGAAFSSNVGGPYTPQDQPLVCPDPNGNGGNANALISSPGQGGAIDASGFQDVDGSLYLFYKVDGNSMGGGGPCGNANGQFATPIMMIPMQDDGVSPRGPPSTAIDRSPADGPLVEAPSISRSPDGTYNLFFSSNCFNTPLYDVTWATAPSINGPWTKFGPLLVTGTNGLQAPGGASIASDGTHMVFHANFGGGRAMFTTSIAGAGSGLRLS